MKSQNFYRINTVRSSDKFENGCILMHSGVIVAI